MKTISQKRLSIITALILTSEPLLHGACTVAATDLNFGVYDVFSGSATNGAGNVNVNCTFLIALALHYTVKLSTGTSGTYTLRKMQKDVSNLLNYNLYTNSGHTTVWGDGTGGTGYNEYTSLIGLLYHNRNYTVYGQIPAQQNVAAGSYSDTITVTVEY